MIRIGLRLAGAAFCAAILFTQTPAGAAGPLNTLATFPGGDSQLEVQTYAQNDTKAGVIEMTTGSARASFLLNAELAEQMLDLWSKAKTMQAGSWSPVGTLTETRPKDASTMSVSAGFGVRLILSDLKAGSLTHVVGRDDMAAFEDALEKVNDFLKP